MENYLNGLNPNQYEAVVSQEKYLRLIAGAGSGKTRVLTTRIAYLIDALHVPAYRILAITFTNKAAAVMRNRVGKILNNENHGVWLSTIHSLCVRVLREEASAINYPRNFTIVDSDDQKSILKEAYKLYNLDVKLYSYNSVLSYIANNKYAGIDPKMALSKAGQFMGEKNKALVYEFYQQRLAQLFAFDFDDLILQTLKIFQLHPQVEAKWQGKFDHIMVDEFQDVDHAEYELVRRLVGHDNSLTVVGDPDQTIYTWRGADVNIILDFAKDYPSCHTILLNQNYRSQPNILKGANSVIQNNKNRLKKDLFTQKESNQKIVHISCVNEEAEARHVINKIKALHHQGLKYSDMAILYRSNYISRQFEKSLLDQQIPYIIWGGIRFYDRAEIKNAIAYLRLLLTQDDLAFKRIINIPRRGIGEISLDTLYEKAREQGISMFEAIDKEPFLPARAQNILTSFKQMVLSWQAKLDDYSMIELLNMVMDESGYRTNLEEERETDRLENIKELVNDMQSYMLQYPESNLDEYLQMVSLYGDKEEDENSDMLRLMTVHSAKGLEFDTVFVVGMSDGVFPSQRALDEGNNGEEEERRLAYVAYTRAMNRLFITDCQGYSFQLQSEKVTSRFVKEMDESVIEHQGLLPESSTNKTVMRNTPSRQYEQAILNKEENHPSVNIKMAGKPVYRPGQKVTHDEFGDGIIVKLDGPFVMVAFAAPFGIKKIAASANAMHAKVKS